MISLTQTKIKLTTSNLKGRTSYSHSKLYYEFWNNILVIFLDATITLSSLPSRSYKAVLNKLNYSFYAFEKGVVKALYSPIVSFEVWLWLNFV